MNAAAVRVCFDHLGEWKDCTCRMGKVRYSGKALLFEGWFVRKEVTDERQGNITSAVVASGRLHVRLAPPRICAGWSGNFHDLVVLHVGD